MSIHRKALAIALSLSAFFLLGASGAAACELSFKLIDETGVSRRILPGATVALDKFATYTLRIEFVEDHRNCLYEPEDTLFLLDDAKWRPQKDEQGLVLSAPIVWKVKTRTLNTSDIVFSAAASGTYDLRIIRECSKGGYDESIIFSVH